MCDKLTTYLGGDGLIEISLSREWVREFLPAPPASCITLSNLECISALSATAMARHVPGSAAVRLALVSAEAMDSQVAEISDELAGQILSAGYQRFLRLSLRRREHLLKTGKALAGHSV